MLLTLSILVMDIIATAIAQANEFTSPPPMGSGEPTVTYVVGSIYPVTWTTTYTDLSFFLQSFETDSSGNPVQSYNITNANGLPISSPFEFDVGTNIDLSLSPFHFEVYSNTDGNGFVSDNFAIVAAGSPTTSAPADQPTAAIASNPPEVVSGVSNPPSVSVETQTFVAATITTASSPTQNMMTVTVTGAQTTATSSPAAKAGTGALTSPGLKQSVVLGLVVALRCIWAYGV